MLFFVMRGLLIALLILSGIVFVVSVLLMSPKGGIGLGLGGWANSSNEYGSKKSLEGKVKKVALAAALVFVLVSLILPYQK